MKTVCPQGRVGSNPTLSAQSFALAAIKGELHNVIVQAFWRSTQVVEGTPLERVQVVNSGARVQIPPSPFEVLTSRMKLIFDK